MREIKFRGKRIDNGKWSYGCYYWNDCDNKPYIMVDWHECHEVGFNTVSQYTGLHDSKGKEIYDGDVVCASNGVLQGVVIYQAPEFIIKRKPHHKTWSQFILSSEENQFQTVIGNIYDNKELIA
jgi:uncharacterized phage protein (TIGR01671 family)